MANNSKAAGKQAKKKAMPRGQPFVKGDPRINRKGRLIPKNMRDLQAVIDEVFAEEMTDANGAKMDKLRIAINRLLLNKTPAGPIHILDRRFGKVPQPIIGSGEDGEIVIVDQATDAQRLKRMKELAIAIAEEVKKNA